MALAGGRSEKRCEDAQRGGFARAIGADEAEEVAAIDGQVQRTQRGHRAVSARQTDGMDGGNGGADSSSIHNSNQGVDDGVTGTDRRQSVFFWLRRVANWFIGLMGE